MLNKTNYNNNKFVYLLLRSVAEDTKELDATNLTLDDNNEETFKGFKEIFCVCFINKKDPWNISKVPLRPQDRALLKKQNVIMKYFALVFIQKTDIIQNTNDEPF